MTRCSLPRRASGEARSSCEACTFDRCGRNRQHHPPVRLRSDRSPWPCPPWWCSRQRVPDSSQVIGAVPPKVGGRPPVNNIGGRLTRSASQCGTTVSRADRVAVMGSSAGTAAPRGSAAAYQSAVLPPPRRRQSHRRRSGCLGILCVDLLLRQWVVSGQAKHPGGAQRSRDGL
jgi:hypothetical protein